MTRPIWQKYVVELATTLPHIQHIIHCTTPYIIYIFIADKQNYKYTESSKLQNYLVPHAMVLGNTIMSIWMFFRESSVIAF